MTDRVIEEVDEKLQGDTQSKKKIIGVNDIYGDLNNTKRQVTKLLSRLKNSQTLPQKQKQQQGKQQKGNTAKMQSVLSKYNYYGKKYRFQVKQEQLRVESPKIQRQCVSEINFGRKQTKQFAGNMAKSQISAINSVNATIDHIDHSLFFDDGQLKMPTQNYYIYFDRPQNKLVNKHQSKQMVKKQNSFNKSVKQEDWKESLPQKFKPAWLMEKKINSLQRELKGMKQRQKRRVNQSLDLRTMHRTTDGPIKLKSNIERMVQSLWH